MTFTSSGVGIIDGSGDAWSDYTIVVFVCCHFTMVIIVAINFDDDVDIVVTFASSQETKVGHSRHWIPTEREKSAKTTLHQRL